MSDVKRLEELLRRGRGAQEAVDKIIGYGRSLTKMVSAESQIIGICPACDQWIQPCQAYTFVCLGPGPDLIERRRAREGKVYNAVRLPVHWACATGEEE